MTKEQEIQFRERWNMQEGEDLPRPEIVDLINDFKFGTPTEEDIEWAKSLLKIGRRHVMNNRQVIYSIFLAIFIIADLILLGTSDSSQFSFGLLIGAILASGQIIMGFAIRGECHNKDEEEDDDHGRNDDFEPDIIPPQPRNRLADYDIVLRN